MASGYLGISQTSGLVVFVEQSNFPFYTFLIRLEIAELAIASYSQLQLVIASGQLVIIQTPSLIVLDEETNFPFYTFLIRLEIAELAIASYSQPQHFWETSQWLASQLVVLVWLNKASIPNFSFLGSLEVTQIYLPGWVGGVGGWVGGCHTDYKTNLSSQLDWH